MRDTNKTSLPKELNELGQAFEMAKQSQQLRFRAALLDAGERERFNYWRYFGDTYKTTNKLGKVPAIVIKAAEQYLQFSQLNQPN